MSGGHDTRSRSALIIANSTYADTTLRRLRAPSRDADELARVLGSGDIGGFTVDRALDEPAHVLRRRIADFFADRATGDLLVMHLSGHGVKDEDGSLYFAAADTDASQLDATALSAEFLNRQMARSRSRSIVLFLDCCFSGAFARDALARGAATVGVKESFGGQGKIVLTSSNAAEYALEGSEIEGEGQPSFFTRAIVEGLETGAADRDGDQLVSVDELYDYVFDAVRRTTPNQTPCKWTFDVRGDIYLARNPAPVVAETSLLPEPLLQALENPISAVRESAAAELGRYLGNRDRRLAAAARLALERLLEDDSRRVGLAASAALAGTAAPDAVMQVEAPIPVTVADAEPAAVEPPDVVPAPAPPPESVVVAPARADEPRGAAAAPRALGMLPTMLWLAGAALVLAALDVPWARSSQLTFVRQPQVHFFWDLAWLNVETVAVAVGSLALLAALRAGRVTAVTAGSVMLGLAIQGLAGGFETIAWVAHRSDQNPPGISPAGGVLLLASAAWIPVAVACLRAAPRRSAQESVAPASVAWMWGAGAIVMLAGLGVHVNGSNHSLVSGVNWFVTEIVVAAALILVVAARSLAGLTSDRVDERVLVAAVGAQSALYFVAVALTWTGDSQGLGFSPGNLVGLAGAVIVLGACARLRSEPTPALTGA
jgi:hypothetical protein